MPYDSNKLFHSLCFPTSIVYNYHTNSIRRNKFKKSFAHMKLIMITVVAETAEVIIIASGSLLITTFQEYTQWRG